MAANMDNVSSLKDKENVDTGTTKHKKFNPADADSKKPEYPNPDVVANMDDVPSQNKDGKEVTSEKPEKPEKSTRTRKASKGPYYGNFSELRYTASQITIVFGEPLGYPKALNAITSKPNVLAFVLLYQSPPQRNMKFRYDFFVGDGNVHLLFQAGSVSNVAVPIWELPRLVDEDVSRAVFPVGLASEHTRRFETKGSWECLGWCRIKSVCYL